jgi:hypothetical protein
LHFTAGAARYGDHAVDVKTLADELIERCCDRHSLGMVYRFLFQAFPNDVSAARAEFENFLAGELSDRLIEAAARCVEADGNAAGRARGKPRLHNGRPSLVLAGISASVCTIPTVRTERHQRSTRK